MSSNCGCGRPMVWIVSFKTARDHINQVDLKKRHDIALCQHCDIPDSGTEATWERTGRFAPDDEVP